MQIDMNRFMDRRESLIIISFNRYAVTRSLSNLKIVELQIPSLNYKLVYTGWNIIYSVPRKRILQWINNLSKYEFLINNFPPFHTSCNNKKPRLETYTPFKTVTSNLKMKRNARFNRENNQLAKES